MNVIRHSFSSLFIVGFKSILEYLHVVSAHMDLSNFGFQNIHSTIKERIHFFPKFGNFEMR